MTTLISTSDDSRAPLHSVSGELGMGRVAASRAEAGRAGWRRNIATGGGQFVPLRGEVSPGGGQLSPGRSHMAPERGEFSPGREQMVPGPGEFSPGRAQLSPRREQLSPRQVQLSPRREQLSPRREQLFPRQVQLSPRRGDMDFGRGHFSAAWSPARRPAVCSLDLFDFLEFRCPVGSRGFGGARRSGSRTGWACWKSPTPLTQHNGKEMSSCRSTY
jgi:hypothetical protein